MVDSTIVSNPLIPDLLGRAFPIAKVRDSAGNTSLRRIPTYFYRVQLPMNYTYQWNLNIQRELANGWLFEVGYLGNGAHS